MKISFSTLGCPRWSWREILATACDLGYGGVEVRGVGNDISVPSIPAFSDENLDKTKAELARLNLAPAWTAIAAFTCAKRSRPPTRKSGPTFTWRRSWACPMCA